MEETINKQKTLWLITLYEGGIGVLAVIIGYFSNWYFWEHFSWNTKELFLSILATVPMFLFFYMIFKLPLKSFTKITKEMKELVPYLFGNLNLIALFYVSLLAGFGEEFLFRGLIQFHLSSFIGQVPSLFIVSILFGLAHLITPGYAIITTIYGFYLGFLEIYFENLLSPVVSHAFYDFIALVYYIYIEKKTPSKDTFSSS